MYLCLFFVLSPMIYAIPVPVNQLRLLGAHNAGSHGPAEIFLTGYLQTAPSGPFQNQDKSIHEQLRLGVRYLDYDTCFFNNEVFSCHYIKAIFGLLSKRAYYHPFQDDLADIIRFLDANPNEVVYLHLNRDVEQANLIQIADGINTSLSEIKSRLIPLDQLMLDGKVPTNTTLINHPGQLVVFLTKDLYEIIPEELKRYVSNANDKITIVYQGFPTFGNSIWFDESTTHSILKQCAEATTPFIDLQVVVKYAINIKSATRNMVQRAEYLMNECNLLRRSTINELNSVNETISFLSVDYIQFFRHLK